MEALIAGRFHAANVVMDEIRPGRQKMPFVCSYER
jgi:hypothetical protein